MNIGGKRKTFSDDEGTDGLSDKKPRAEEAQSSRRAASFRLTQLQGNPVQDRRTNDEIHTTIHLGPVVTAVMDTPHMQRLRSVKQLGTAEYVYNNSNHNRFEHSLGVGYLARRMITRVQTRQPQLPCSPKDVLCVELAGLLHDIGHGPLSHIFEGFIKHAHPAFLRENPQYRQYYEDNLPKFNVEEWKHEEVSLKMIDALLAYLGMAIDLENLDAPLKQIGDGVDAKTMRIFDMGLEHDADAILTSRDWIFVKECIYGGPIAQTVNNHPAVRKLIGRPREKEWMYDIVSNGHSGLDVDKMDYFARDQRRAFGTAGDVNVRMIDDVCVAWGRCSAKPGKCIHCQSFPDPEKKHLMICYGEKIENSAMNFFKERYVLHESIYRHKTVQAVAYMIQDIFSLADPFLRIPVSNRYGTSHAAGLKKEYSGLPMSLAVLDMNAFERLTDSVIPLIEAKEDSPELRHAQDVIRRLRCRDIYKCKGELPISLNDSNDKELWKLSESQIKVDLLSISGEHDNGTDTPLKLEAGDFIVEKKCIHHGSGESNPLENMRFVKKRDEFALNQPLGSLPEAMKYNEKKLEADRPRSFQSNCIRVFSRNKAKDDLLEHVFDTWVENRDKVVTAGPPEMCFNVDQPHQLTQEGDEEDSDDHGEQGIFDLGLGAAMARDNQQDADNDDASVDLGEGRDNAARAVPSPSALVSPERIRRRSNS